MLEESQFQRLTEMAQRIEEAQVKVDTAAKEALGAGAPKSAFGYYNQVKEEIDRMVKSIQPQLAMSDATQIKLKELELEQARVLAQISTDTLKSNQVFDGLVMIFREYVESKRAEGQRKVANQVEIIRGISDLVAVIGEAVSMEKK